MTHRPGPRICALLLAPAVGLFASGCEKTTTTVTSGPTPVKCAVTLSLNQGTLPAAGATGTVTVGTTPECAWTGLSDVPWITNLSPTSGQGPGQIQFQVPVNPSANFREGQIIVNDIGTRVTQAGTACQVSLDPTSNSFTSAGGAGGVAVASTSGCTWTATSNASWLVVTSDPPSGSGNGIVTYSVTANSGVARVGVLTIGSQTFVVTQAAPVTVPCNNTISPTSQSLGSGGGSTTVNIQAIASCSWTAASNVPWLAITGVGAGSGNGSVTVTAQPNTGPSRTGTATIAGQTFTVNQTGSCLSSINPPSQNVPLSAGAATPVTVTIAAGCPWTATTSTPWITITSGASGNGDGMVGFNVAANTGGPRSGSILIAGQTHTVNQAGSCTASINPTNQSIGAGGGSGVTVNVTIPTGCAWTSSTAATWITINTGATGNGNGTVTYTVAPNAGPARSDTINIAGQIFTVNQASGCSVSINPSNQSIGAAGGAGVTINVTAPTGCAWTAGTTDTWITVTAGASGSGNGTVTYTVAANAGAARTGTISIGGQTFTVNQAAICPVSLNPTSQTIAAAGGTANVTVAAAGTCAWTAVDDAPWITITAGSSGTGNGTVTFTVAPNTGTQRVGTITVNGQTHTVTQSAPAPSCTFSIKPTSMSMPSSPTTSSPVNVTTASGCAWQSVPNATWITIQTGASGSGNGTMTFRVSNNSSSNSRIGTITIAGLIFTVTQAGDDEEW